MQHVDVSWQRSFLAPSLMKTISKAVTNVLGLLECDSLPYIYPYNNGAYLIFPHILWLHKDTPNKII